MRLSVPTVNPAWAVVGLVVCGVAAWLIWPRPAPVVPAVIATSAPAVAHVSKVDAPIKAGKIRVYGRKAKQDLALPAVVAEDPKQAVVESTIVNADRHDTVVTTLVDMETGETLTLAQRQPLPWLAPGGRNTIWIGAGWKNAEPAMRVQGVLRLAEVKAWHVSLQASLDVPMSSPGQTDWFAGIGIGRDW